MWLLILTPADKVSGRNDDEAAIISTISGLISKLDIPEKPIAAEISGISCSPTLNSALKWGSGVIEE